MEITNSDLMENFHRAYLIGIGGVGMSALARVLKHQGLAVAGSDSKESKTTRDLNASGIPVFIGQKNIGFNDEDVIIYSSAIDTEHVELKAARQSGKRVLHRAQVLSSLLNRAQTSVAVTGTHGKTTTSSMISFMLSQLGKNPTCLVGGEVMNFGTNTLLGNPDLWISEVDESDKSHEMYAPNYTIVTNLEEDHIDHYKDMNDLQDSFRKFFANTRNPGLLIYSEDDTALRNLVLESGKPRLSFGFSPAADFSAQNIRISDFGSEFDLCESGLYAAHVKLSIPGLHNISNALAALALLSQIGVDLEAAGAALVDFRGARRRLEVKFESPEIMIVDDYAHHPTEVKASIRALRQKQKHLTVVFQPHRYSRTRYFFKEFGRAFSGADEVILTDIYSAGEKNVENINVKCIYDEAVASGHSNVHFVAKKDILNHLFQASHHGIVAFIGAGDIGELADELAGKFKNLTPA